MARRIFSYSFFAILSLFVFTPAQALDRKPISLGIKTTAKSVLVIDMTPGHDPKILFQKNASKAMPLASVTKLMTLLVFHDIGDANGDVTMDRGDESPDEPGAQRIDVKPGDKVSKQDLIAASLIYSANNAVKALVRSTAIGSAKFVERMNLTAKNLGMSNTHFEDPTGLSLGNTTTALDLVRLANAAFENSTITQNGNKPVYRFTTVREVKGVGEAQIPHTIRHTDRLLDSFLNQESKGFAILGSKTGHLAGAGYNLVAKVKKGDKEIIVIVLGSETSDTRFQEAKGLAWWAFQQI